MSQFVALMLAARLVAAVQNVTPAQEGVYTGAQAERGKTVAQEHCTRCHGLDLTGAEGPALVGDTFMLSWENRNLEMLFRKIRDTMPAEAVASITDDEKLDAVAYLMKQNGFTEGAAELPHNAAAQARIPLSRQNGAPTLRTGSLVRVAGCLSQGPGNVWVLMDAGEPRPAGSPDAQKPTDVLPAGNQTVRLFNVFPEPSAHKGHKIDVNGLLVRDEAGVAVNVLSLEMVAPACN
jgi:mono/diheme cytochrome c family protein